jgi:LytS/YehU family sensor histidine kinase
VAVAVPIASVAAYCLTTLGDQQPWWQDSGRASGFIHMTVFGLLVAPWVAVAALVRQISGAARTQALAFELERSELERRALDARLRLLQAQTEPHFLFNTLANVRELVDTGSPRASAVLGSLISYLRAAVPRLHDPSSTLELELELVRAYLEVMHMRMPDRLQFAIHAEGESLPVYCPQLTLLTLVENAVRHGIDPSEKGGRIDVRVRVERGRCRADVIDTGVGLDHHDAGMGIGLANLLERLQLAFGGEVEFQLSALEPHGARAELVFPTSRRLV